MFHIIYCFAQDNKSIIISAIYFRFCSMNFELQSTLRAIEKTAAFMAQEVPLLTTYYSSWMQVTCWFIVD